MEPLEPLIVYLQTAISHVQAAGAIIRQFRDGYKDFEVKSCDIDLVTEFDEKVEQIIIGGLKLKFPSHKFIGEESVAGGEPCELTDAPTWIIDPIDGTMNFIHGFPHYCISVALAINKECVAGIIYDPNADQLFTAMKGDGAYLNANKLHVSDVQELRKALVGFEVGTSRDEERFNVMIENFKHMVGKAHGVRALGSAALNMAMVALGATDAYFEFGIHAWDIAAGELIVREAGGVCIDPSGGPLDLMSRRVLCASTPELANEIANTLVQFYPERD